MKKYYVYTLAYPESMGGTIFYVGKGSGNRIDQHEMQARNGTWESNASKVAIIQKIWETGGQVVKEKVAFFDNEPEAYMYEWALLYMSCMAEGLMNRPRTPRPRPSTPSYPVLAQSCFGPYDEMLSRMYDKHGREYVRQYLLHLKQQGTDLTDSRYWSTAYYR